MQAADAKMNKTRIVLSFWWKASETATSRQPKKNVRPGPQPGRGHGAGTPKIGHPSEYTGVHKHKSQLDTRN